MLILLTILAQKATVATPVRPPCGRPPIYNYHEHTLGGRYPPSRVAQKPVTILRISTTGLRLRDAVVSPITGRSSSCASGIPECMAPDESQPDTTILEQSIANLIDWLSRINRSLQRHRDLSRKHGRRIQALEDALSEYHPRWR